MFRSSFSGLPAFTKFLPLAALSGFLLTPAFAGPPVFCGPGPVTRLSFDTKSVVRVDPNVLKIRLSAQTAGPTAAIAQQKLNQTVSGVLATIQSQSDSIPKLESHTQNYSVHQDYSSNLPASRRPWTAEQDIVIKAPVEPQGGKSGAALLRLGGDLQKSGLTLSAIEWGISDQTRDAAQDAATQKALAELKSLAEKDAAALGLQFRSLADVIVLTEGANPGPRPLMAIRGGVGMSADGVPPQSPGEPLSVRVQVHASACLNPVR